MIEPRIGPTRPAERMAAFARALQALRRRRGDRTAGTPPVPPDVADHRGRGGGTASPANCRATGSGGAGRRGHRRRHRDHQGQHRILHTGFDAPPAAGGRLLPAAPTALLRDYAAGRASPRAHRRPPGRLDRRAGRALPAIAEKAEKNGFTATARSPHRGSTAREPHLGPGRAAGLAHPGESDHLPLDSSARLRHRGGARLCGSLLGRRLTRVRRAAPRSRAPATARAPSAPLAINAAGLGADAIDAMLGSGASRSRPRRGELIVFDKLARPLLGRDPLPVPTETTKGVLVAPPCSATCLLGPTAEDIRDRSDHRHHRRPGRPARGRKPDRPGTGR